MNNFFTVVNEKTAFAVTSQLLQAEYREPSPVFRGDASIHGIPSCSDEASIFVLATNGIATINFSGLSNTYEFVPPDLRFRQLVGEWHKERGATSSITAMVLCPAYQKIIAMGSEAIPLILRQMESEGNDPDHWSWALRALTSVNPIPDAIRGNMKAIADAWLTWARSRYVW